MMSFVRVKQISSKDIRKLKVQTCTNFSTCINQILFWLCCVIMQVVIECFVSFSAKIL